MPAGSTSYPTTPAADTFGTPYAYTPAGGETPAETPFGAETPWHGAPNEQPRWYEKTWDPVKNEHRRLRHPYESKASAVQSTAQPRMKATDVVFWPWVGPWVPGRAAPGIDWEEYSRMVVVAFPNCIVVGRVSDAKPWEPLWTFAFPSDQIFQATWSYDLYTRHPLVLCAGKQGLMYMLDGVTHKCLRIFRGHGNDILSISVCKSHPYLVATTSTDKTTRIWNLLGAPPPPIPKDERSDNYPMGDADEGTECFAILGGEGFGHRAKSFHPRHAALMTGGADHAVKIWALPKFPLPDKNFTTPRGYRPQVLHFPIFSTARIHDSIIDWVEWVGPDVIASREAGSLVLWHWLGYKRFFHPSRFYALSTNAQYHDMHESHSWGDLSRYPVPNGSISNRWYIKPAIHHAFEPTPDEEDEFEENRNLVTGCLLAMPVESKNPEIHVVNPSLCRDDPPEPAYRNLRPKEADAAWDPLPGETLPSEYEEVEEGGDEGEPLNVPLAQDGSTTNVRIESITTLPATSTAPGPDTDLSYIDRVKLHPRASVMMAKPTSAETPPRRKGKEGKDDALLSRYINKSMMPWIVNAKEWPAVRKMSPAFKWVNVEKSIIGAVAISPRGGKWMIGVGDIGSVFVFRLKDKIQA